MKKKNLILVVMAIVMSLLVACQSTEAPTENKNDNNVVIETPTPKPSENPDIVGENIEVSGAIGVANSITVETVEKEDYANVVETLEDATAVAIFDINLTKDDVKVQPNGDVTVTITLTDELLKAEGDGYVVYRLEEGGDLTALTSKLYGNKLSFITNHFSIYIVEKVASPTQAPTETPSDENDEIVSEEHKHSYKETVVAPTCTEKGYTKYECECGDSYTGNEVKATGHSFTNYVYNDDATTEKDGTSTASCDNGCGKTDTVVVEGTKVVSDWVDCNKVMYVLPPVGDAIIFNDAPNGNMICCLPDGTKVTVLSVNEKENWCRIKYNGQEGYVMYSFLSDTHPNPLPDPEPEKPKVYDGYDEFGNGYVWKNLGREVWKVFDADNPYNCKTIYETSETEVYFYNVKGEDNMSLAASKMLGERFGPRALFDIIIENVGVYNGKYILKETIKYIGQF